VYIFNGLIVIRVDNDTSARTSIAPADYTPLTGRKLAANELRCVRALSASEVILCVDLIGLIC
jgi:hypothetical protein